MSKTKTKSLLTLYKNVTYIMLSVLDSFTAIPGCPELTYIVVGVSEELHLS